MTEQQARPRRQEQEPASDEVTEVADGILRMMLPIDLPGLGHVNCYALQDSRGVALVDPGLPGPSSWDALVARLNQAGYRLDHVHTVVVTHSHFDHFGAAQRLRDDAGADILTHEDFRLTWNRNEAGEIEDSDVLDLADEDHFERIRERMRAKTPWGTERYVPSVEELRQFSQWGGPGRLFPTPEPSIRVHDTQPIVLADREWTAVHTPGHTADHLCLFDNELGVMLSGDHVLPTITPHISGYSEHPDPLADFFDSLHRMTTFTGVTVALPAHGHPFDDLAGRADAIVEHHEERLDTIRHSIDDIGEATVSDHMRMLFRERSWGEMAESETYAHLAHLRELGEVVAGEADGLMTFQPA